MDSDLVLTPAQAGKILGISERRVREIVKAGGFPKVPHLGPRTILIPRQAFERIVSGES